VVPAPLIIAKVTNKGTDQLRDDRLLPGARIEIRIDDGDGKYEPTTDDSKIGFDGVADKGFLIFRTPPDGDYWVVEADAPTGFEKSRPLLVHYPADIVAGNCVQIGNKQHCLPDDDASGGILLVVISDTPAQLPRTDTAAVNDTDMARRLHRGGRHERRAWTLRRRRQPT
jgi:hypothetical protein